MYIGIIGEVSVLINLDQCSIYLLQSSVYMSIIAEISVSVLINVDQYSI